MMDADVLKKKEESVAYLLDTGYSSEVVHTQTSVWGSKKQRPRLTKRGLTASGHL